MTEEEIKYHNRLWYYKTYNQLIDKCIQMEKDGYPEDMYTEVHHILPRCQGGTNDKSNLVRMPVRYHIMAHILLAYAFPDNVSLAYAAGMIINTNIFSKSSDYKTTKRFEALKTLSTSTIARIREHTSILRSIKSNTKEEKERLANINKGRKLTEEHKRKISESEKGRVITPEHREKIRQANLKNRSKWTKRVQGPDGTIYNSLKECYTSVGKSKKTMMRWIHQHPEKGYKYIDY